MLSPKDEITFLEQIRDEIRDSVEYASERREKFRNDLQEYIDQTDSDDHRGKDIVFFSQFCYNTLMTK